MTYVYIVNRFLNSKSRSYSLKTAFLLCFNSLYKILIIAETPHSLVRVVVLVLVVFMVMVVVY